MSPPWESYLWCISVQSEWRLLNTVTEKFWFSKKNNSVTFFSVPAFCMHSKTPEQLRALNMSDTSSQAQVSIARQDLVCFPFGRSKDFLEWTLVIINSVTMEHFTCTPFWSSSFSYQDKMLWFSSAFFRWCQHFHWNTFAILKFFWKNRSPFEPYLNFPCLLTHLNSFSYRKAMKWPFCKLSSRGTTFPKYVLEGDLFFLECLKLWNKLTGSNYLSFL